MTALFIAQSRQPGEKPGNTMPIDNPDKVSWIDLIATPARASGRGVSYSGVRSKKLRTFHSALQRLADPGVQLVELPNAGARSGTYENFLLLQEGGAPRDGSGNDRYTVPDPDTVPLLELPAGLFSNGWIHVLEDRELTFLLMLAYMHQRFPSAPAVFIAGELRLLHFGVGREAYQSHHLLHRLGLITVKEDQNRGFDGRVRNYGAGKVAELHRFQLVADGFAAPAIEPSRRPSPGVWTPPRSAIQADSRRRSGR